ncbi:MAG: hypothetical protein JST20_10715 [Bacteroidetes bacterium]|nr:hypothetical protein [Bacteroidota bacterium]
MKKYLGLFFAALLHMLTFNAKAQSTKIWHYLLPCYLILICGCNNISPTKTDPSNLSVSAPNNIGIWHNQGVAQLKTTGTLTVTYSSNLDRANAILSCLSGYFYSTQSWDSSEMHNAHAIDSMKHYFDDSLYSNSLSLWLRGRNNPVITQYVSAVELALIDSAFAIFSQDFSSMSRVQVCATIQNQANSLINQYNSKNWDSSECSGELAAGVLQIMKYSAIYWAQNQNWDTTNVDIPDNGSTAYVILQLDCAGYITGWAAALWDDMHSSGGVQLSGQERRIGQGVIWGASASGIGRYVK